MSYTAGFTFVQIESGPYMYRDWAAGSARSFFFFEDTSYVSAEEPHEKVRTHSSLYR